jgi:hypothetical protein
MNEQMHTPDQRWTSLISKGVMTPMTLAKPSITSVK